MNTSRKSATSTSGRPRDEEVDNRIRGATLIEFCRRGWKDLSIQGIAKAAGVGKASIYLRWNSLEDIVHFSIDTSVRPHRFDGGDAAKELLSWIIIMMERASGELGMGLNRLFNDPDLPPVLAQYRDYLAEDSVEIARKIRVRALEQEVLAPDINPRLFIDMIAGPIISRKLASSIYNDIEPVQDDDLAFAKRLVSLVLRSPPR